MAKKTPGPGQKREFKKAWERALDVLKGKDDGPEDPNNNTWWAFGYRHGLQSGSWDEKEVERAYEWTKKENARDWHKGKNVDVSKYLKSKHDGEPAVEKKYSRICWNTNNWQRPSGDARELEHDSYVAEKGFGHEEWLFNFTWLLKGYVSTDNQRYNYGFLQPINKHLKKCQGQTFSVLLYTRSPEGKLFIVARIDNLYVPEDDELDWALHQMVKNGWVETMRREVEALGGRIDVSPLTNPKAQEIVDVRFRPQDVTFYDPFLVTPEDHKISRTPRYQLLNWDDEFPEAASAVPVLPPATPDEEDDPTRSEAQRTRSRVEGTSYDPRHVSLQNRLYWKLRNRHGAGAVRYENDRVDLTVEADGEITLIEIKMELTAKHCIRAALGQLLEYAHYGDGVKADRLLIVGDRPPGEEDVAYLKKLRELYALPLYYAQWDWETEEIGEEV
jgi:hypothetical protein